MTVYYPSLTDSGWITSSPQILDNLLADAYESDYSQTALYRGQVFSIAYVIQEGQGDIPRTIGLLQEGLSRYLKRYFQEVAVEVYRVSALESSSKVELSMYINVTDQDNKSINAAKLLEVTNGQLTNIVTLNNG
jgi:hypothetical protein